MFRSNSDLDHTKFVTPLFLWYCGSTLAVILQCRIYAMYNRSRTVMIPLVAFFVITVIASCVLSVLPQYTDNGELILNTEELECSDIIVLSDSIKRYDPSLLHGETATLDWYHTCTYSPFRGRFIHSRRPNMHTRL